MITQKQLQQHSLWATTRHSDKPQGERLIATDANLEDANLRSANLEGANLEGADLEGADLRSANLEGANLRGANLRGANLRSANLEGADLEGADLEGADLRSANLEGANLRSANLEGANLRGANLRSADLRGADLEGADLEPIKQDAFIAFASLSWELPKLREAFVAGRIDGTAYEGECACFVGTVAKERGENYAYLGIALQPDSRRPMERLLLGVTRGDMPSTNPISAIFVGWIDEYLARR